MKSLFHLKGYELAEMLIFVVLSFDVEYKFAWVIQGEIVLAAFETCRHGEKV